MGSILHVEPITRQTPYPLNIGHYDFIPLGEYVDDNGESIGGSTSGIRLGCPLEISDTGNTTTSIPLVKTIEFEPDHNHPGNHVYLETVHYLHKNKTLYPIRTKIRNGAHQGTRLSHLPSLNKSRSLITGMRHPVINPQSDIVMELLHNDRRFNYNNNVPLREWIREDLSTKLSKSPMNYLTFDSADIVSTIHRYNGQLHTASNELRPDVLRSIANTVFPVEQSSPAKYCSLRPIERTVQDLRVNLFPHTHNFRSFGSIPIDKVERVDYNPFQFQSICNLIDCIPLTDFNIDFVVRTNCNIELYHENVAVDRLSVFDDHDIGLYLPETIILDSIDGYVLNEILQKFVYYHSNMTEESDRYIRNNPVKIKIIKTITDEAAILLYPYNGHGKQPPLCGVYFDIALQSLAPMSIIPEDVLDDERPIFC